MGDIAIPDERGSVESKKNTLSPRPPPKCRRTSMEASPLQRKTQRRMSFKDLANVGVPPGDKEARMAAVVRRESMAHQLAKKSPHYIDVKAIKAIVSSPPHERSNQDLETLITLLKPFKEFKSGPGMWTKNTQLNLCRCVTARSYPPETKIFNQGDEGDEFFMILQGSVNVKIKGKIETPVGNGNSLTGEKRTTLVDSSDWAQIATLQPGESFGELALMRNEPRSATIMTGHASANLLVVRKFDYDASIKGLHMQEAANRISFLHRVPIFSQWTANDLSALSLQMKRLNFMTNSIVIRQGEPALNVYFIVEGRCRILKRLHVECYQTSIICELGELSSLNWFGKVLLSSQTDQRKKDSDASHDRAKEKHQGRKNKAFVLQRDQINADRHNEIAKGKHQKKNEDGKASQHATPTPGAGAAGGHYDCSVQATSNLVVYQLSREDVVRRSQQFLHALNAGSTPGLSSAGMIQPLQSNDEVNQAIEETIKWDVFKRQTVCNALSEKRAQFIQKQRSLNNNGNPNAMAHARWIEAIGEDYPQERHEGLLSPIKRPNSKFFRESASNGSTDPLKMSYLSLLESDPSVLPQ